MSTPRDTIWRMDDHTKAKHVILRKYLDAWLPIMTTHNERVLIIDGFAGPGEYKDGEIGSPLIMINAFLNHSYPQLREKEVNFLFVEEVSKRYNHLEQLLAQHKREHDFPPHASYQVFQGSFDETMTAQLDQLEEHQSRLAPMFAFIDPFGYSHTPMSMITRLMNHPKCEVLITFMYEEINRFLAANYTGKDGQYDQLFGTQEWRTIRSNAHTSEERRRLLHDLYRDQLRSIGSARYVRSFCMRNKHNATDYFLFFATNSLKGMEKMKEAMHHVDPTGTYEFSDFTDRNQLLLFSEPNYEELKHLLSSHFKGQTVSIEEIKEYVIAETAFWRYKTEALKAMELASPLQIKVISTDSRRRKGTFAEGKTRIQFLGSLPITC